MTRINEPPPRPITIADLLADQQAANRIQFHHLEQVHKQLKLANDRVDTIRVVLVIFVILWVMSGAIQFLGLLASL